MKRTVLYAYIFLFPGIIQGWGSEQSTGSQARKQKFNFEGTLTKYTGKTKVLEIDNISLAGIIKDISVFEVPEQAAGILKRDPRKGTVSSLDLKEIAKIEAPEPEKTWIFKRSDLSDGIEYIEIVITPRGGGEEKHYLIERTRKLHYDEETTAGPIPTQTPFYEIQSLVILSCNERCKLPKKAPLETACRSCEQEEKEEDTE